MLTTSDGRFRYYGDGMWRDTQSNMIVPTWILDAYLARHPDVSLIERSEHDAA